MNGLKYTTSSPEITVSINFTLPQDHIARVIHDFVESLNIPEPSGFGRPVEYDAKMLLKLLLFSYSRGITTSRQIECFAIENLPARWLTGNACPSYRTICRFRISDHLKEILTDSFDVFRAFLKEHDLMDEALFIDGTKVLADANKYTFVWKKNTLRFEKMNRDAMIELLNHLRQLDGRTLLDPETNLTVEELEEILLQIDIQLETLEETIEAEPRRSPNPNKQKRRHLKSQRRKLAERTQKIQQYEEQKAILGERSSYSKTDHDATFMRMKDDPMRNGQLKPGYNLQVATCNQFFLAYDLFPNPTDTRTLIPFIQSHRQLIQDSTFLVADAGYGSEPNYRFLEDECPHLTALIPYNTYLKEQSKAWKSDERKVMNWTYVEEDDYYIDPHGVRFNFHAYRTRTDQYEVTRDFKEYVAETVDVNQQPIPEALTKKGYKRRIHVNPSYEYFKAQQREQLSDPEYAKVYARRKIDVEPAFGFLKACLGFTRFHVRGIDKVKQEVGLALMAANLRKLARL